MSGKDDPALKRVMSNLKGQMGWRPTKYQAEIDTPGEWDCPEAHLWVSERERFVPGAPDMPPIRAGVADRCAVCGETRERRGGNLLPRHEWVRSSDQPALGVRWVCRLCDTSKWRPWWSPKQRSCAYDFPARDVPARNPRLVF